MPDRITGDMVRLNPDESYTDGIQTVRGPQDVRVAEFPQDNLIQIHGTDTEGNEAKIEVEVEGGTIENFCKKG